MLDVGDFTVFHAAGGGACVRVNDADNVEDQFVADLTRDEVIKLAGALLATVAIDRAATVQDIITYTEA